MKTLVPYLLALEMKKLGFDEKCFGFYSSKGVLIQFPNFNVFWNSNKDIHYNRTIFSSKAKAKETMCLAPTWEQAFDFFWDQHKLHSFIDIYPTPTNPERCWFMIRGKDLINSDNEADNSYMSGWYDNKDKAKKGCLTKLISLKTQAYE